MTERTSAAIGEEVGQSIADGSADTLLPAYARSGSMGGQLLKASSNLLCFCRQGIIEYVNAQGIRMLRAEVAANLVGRPFTDLCDDDFGALMRSDLDAFTEEDTGTPMKLMTLTGAWIDVTLTVCRLETLPDDEADDPIYLIECQNITEYVKTSEMTRRREARISRILQTITEAIVTTDELGEIEDFNPAAEKMFGISKQIAVGSSVNILMKPAERAAHDRAIHSYLESGVAKILGEPREVEAARADGSVFALEITVSEIDEGDGRHKFIGVLRDITERKQQLEQIEFLAHHDAVTGLPNRHLFEDRLQQTLVSNQRRGARMALMFIDLDKFKPINDKLGHEAGDIVLKAIAMRLLERMRASDTVARVGGDEFVVILDAIDTDENVGQVAQSIIDVLTSPIEAGGEECTVGASIGIAIFPEDADSGARLLACADQTMYKVKESGRNNYKFYSASNKD